MGDLPKPDSNTLTQSFGQSSTGVVGGGSIVPHTNVSRDQSSYAQYQQQQILQQFRVQKQMQADPALSSMYDASPESMPPGGKRKADE